MTTIDRTLAIPCAATRPTVADIVAAHEDFLWRSLQRLGTPEADLADLAQEVLLVVHQRLGDFDTSRPMPPWLFGICLRVVLAHRRRAWVRRERPVEHVPEDPHRAAQTDPETAASDAEARGRAVLVLDAMDPEKRAVFVMYEIEEMSGDAIAEVMGVPVGTVWSRLHAARRQFESIVARLDARDGWRRPR